MGGKDTESSGKGGDINLIRKSKLILTLNNVLDIKKIDKEQASITKIEVKDK